MNLSFQILIAPATHDLSYNPAKAARRYAQGDLVDIWNADIIAPYDGQNHVLREPISNPRFAFVHVRGVPDRPLSVVKERLLATDTEVGTFWDEEDQRNAVAIIGYYRRKRFNTVISSIPANVRNRLQADRQITVTWTQVKNYVKNLRADVPLSDNDLT